MKTHKKDTHWLVGVAMMAAIVVLLANTPLGLINIPPIKATTIHIPVIVGAILLGPMAGGVLGGVFGICSVISNTIAPVPASICFSPVLAVSVGGALGAVKALGLEPGACLYCGDTVIDAQTAQRIAALDIPCFACAPDRLPELLERVLKGQDLSVFSSAQR